MREDYKDRMKMNRAASEINETNKSPEENLILSESGIVEGFYEDELLKGAGNRSLDQIVAELNLQSVNERFEVFEQDNGEKRIVKLILPERVVNAERLLNFIKNSVVPIYEKVLRTQGISLQRIEEIKKSLSVRKAIRAFSELLSIKDISQELYDEMSGSLALEEIELFMNLQPRDEKRIVRDVYQLRRLQRAHKVVRPLQDDDLLLCILKKPH